MCEKIKMLKHFSHFVKYLGTKGAGEFGMIRGQVKSLQEQRFIQFAKMQRIGPMLLMKKNLSPKT